MSISRTMTEVRSRLRPFLLPAVLIVVAEIAGRSAELTGIPLPSQMAVEILQAARDGSLFDLTGQTLIAAGGGLILGSLIGLPLGVWFGLSPRINRGMVLAIECFRPIPSIALLPIALMIYGLGFKLEIALVAFATSWPMLLFSRAAAQSVHPRLIEIGRLMGFSRLSCFFKIIFPAAASGIFVGFRLAVGIALVVAITVEIAANPIGLGNAMMLAEQSMHPALMFALIVWTGILGCSVNGLLHQGQKHLFENRGMRSEAP